MWGGISSGSSPREGIFAICHKFRHNSVAFTNWLPSTPKQSTWVFRDTLGCARACCGGVAQTNDLRRSLK